MNDLEFTLFITLYVCGWAGLIFYRWRARVHKARAKRFEDRCNYAEAFCKTANISAIDRSHWPDTIERKEQ